MATATVHNLRGLAKAPSGNLLRIAQVAERLSLKPSTIRAWVLLRKIAYVKIGGAVRISEAEVERIIRDGMVPARPDRI
jgi:excisionase family DNA binding protein